MNIPKQQIVTKNKVYLARDIDNYPGHIIITDDTSETHNHRIDDFDKLTFIDIWELKRNGKI